MARRFAAYGSQGVGMGGGGSVASISSLQRTSEKNIEYIKGLARYAHRDLSAIFDEAEMKELASGLLESAKAAAATSNEISVTDSVCRRELTAENNVSSNRLSSSCCYCSSGLISLAIVIG
jgi:hypothetical protein